MATINGNNNFKPQQPVSRQLMFVALGTAAILLVPLVAMQFSTEVNWDLFDFAVMGTLLMGMGAMYVVVSSVIVKKQHRTIVGVVMTLALMLMWAELAVGVFGSPLAGS